MKPQAKNKSRISLRLCGRGLRHLGSTSSVAKGPRAHKGREAQTGRRLQAQAAPGESGWFAARRGVLCVLECHLAAQKQEADVGMVG